MNDSKLIFILEFLNNHDPDFSAEYKKHFPTTGNTFLESLDWMNWIFS